MQGADFRLDPRSSNWSLLVECMLVSDVANQRKLTCHMFKFSVGYFCGMCISVDFRSLDVFSLFDLETELRFSHLTSKQEILGFLSWKMMLHQ